MDTDFLNKTVLTGITASGTPHVGNMIAAMDPAIAMTAGAKDAFLFIADLHALNKVQDSAAIHQSALEIAAAYLALGLDADKAAFFRQSDIPEIYQLTTLFMNITPKGLMNRAHAYKAAIAENEDKKRDLDAGINMGLYTYPILMAADILLYDADIVPVGQDQKQNVEFARDIAGSLNHAYGQEILTMPEPVIGEDTGIITGLDGRKMSKSYGNTIPIFEESKRLRKLVMKIVTDSKLPEEPKDPDNSTIIQLYTHFADDAAVKALRDQFVAGGIGYGDAKQMLFEAMDKKLTGPREAYKELMADPQKIETVLAQGAARARPAAQNTLARVHKAMLG